LISRLAYKEDDDENDYSEFFSDSKAIKVGDTRFIIGISQQNPISIIIAFRGTVNTNNWKANLNIKLTQIDDNCKSTNPTTNKEKYCYSHEGFLKYYRALESQLKKIIEDYKKKNQIITDIVFTGHSLGGALATLAAYDVCKKHGCEGMRSHLVTFGSPRVGNKIFAFYVDFSLGLTTNARITYQEDNIVATPDKNYKQPETNEFKEKDEYRHVGIEVNFDSKEEGKVVHKDERILVLSKVAKIDFSNYKTINHEKITNLITTKDKNQTNMSIKWDKIQKISLPNKTKNDKNKIVRIRKRN